MKAAVYHEYGPPEVVKIEEVKTPTPKANEVRVKVFATTVSAGDVRMRSFDVPRWQWLFARLYLGVWKPKRNILGMQIAGEIDAVGKEVTLFQPGDQVFASTFASHFGGHAEYKCIPEDGVLARKPSNMSYQEAAAVPTPGIGAFHILKKANIQPGQQVLVYGASGSVGTFAVQIAKAFGAEVTGVCRAAKAALVSSLGASHVIDYTQEDATSRGDTYDLIFDAVDKISFSIAKKALKPKTGVFLSINKDSTGETKEDLLQLKALIEEGKLKSVIDQVYPLDEIVAAHRHVDTGHKKGNVIVTMPHNS